MQTLAQDVKKLLPYLYDSHAYGDAKNRPEVMNLLTEFSKAAHRIQPATGRAVLGDDLLVEYSLENLEQDLKRATQSYSAGQFEYSRSVAKSSLSHCFRCHSVAHPGGSAPWDLETVQSLKLAPLEKADLLVATRKTDQALAFMEQQLNSAEFQAQYAFDFESLLRRYLALIIRVEKSPDRALKELNKILAQNTTPHYIADQATGWRQSLQSWSKEKASPAHSPAELFAQADRRFKRAETLQRYQKDHAGDVEYLRATALLHGGLKDLKSPKDAARALYLLGKAYEVLDELGSWNLHESYYEACLLRDPKSETAKRCFNRLEASLYMGYSGSSGVHLPNEEKDRLRRLKEML